MLSSGNSELRADGIYTWSIPALAVKLSNGKNFLTCPNAGSCASLCYARNGTFLFRNVKAKHVSNLERVLDNPDQWMNEMIEELNKPKYRPTGKPRAINIDPVDEDLRAWIKVGGKAVRIHDSGDFFNEDYYRRWQFIAKCHPDVMFYAYTKEIEMVKAGDKIKNLRIIFSMGGKQDNLIDKENDRHAEVFPNMEALNDAGYVDQEDSDLLAFLLPTTKIGIVANNIPHFKKKQGLNTFGQLQEARSL